MSMSISISSSVSRMSVKKAIEECGKKFGFDVEEALRMLNQEKKEKKEKVEKSKYPLPFNGEKRENCCNGIVKNHGLYTQCEKKVKENEYCKGCESQPYGNITDRLSVDLYDYKDPKGKIPKRYTEVLKKLKLSKEIIEEESKRLNITINPIHFEEVAENVKRGRPKSEKKVKEPTGKKGRPKKEKKVVEVNNNEEEDLFATLIANANAQSLKKVEPNSVEEVVEESLEEEVEEEVEESKEVALPKTDKKAKKVKEVDPAKEAEKLKKAVEKAAKEAEKLKKAEEKAAKEAEKLKKAEEKAAKEAEKLKKAEEKSAKEAEKLKKAEEKAAKEGAKESKKNSKDEEEEADVVKKIEFEGKPYYKSNKSGVIYNMDQEVVGKWNTESNKIDFEEEEEEEEYDD
jgi:hypothetical protein